MMIKNFIDANDTKLKMDIFFHRYLSERIQIDLSAQKETGSEAINKSNFVG